MAAITLRTYVFLDNMQDQLAGFIGTTARGYLPVGVVAALFIEAAPGLVIDRLEIEPAGYIAFAPNEALRAANVKLVDASLFGAYGRLYLSGPEARVDAAQAAARRAVEGVAGQLAASRPENS